MAHRAVGHGTDHQGLPGHLRIMKASLARILKLHPGIETLARKLRSLTPPADGEFWYWYRLFDEMESWDLDRIREYQLGRLRVLLSCVKETNAFYGKYLRDIEVESIGSLAEFSRIFPPLSRHDYSTNYRDILVRDPGCRLSQVSTSGTTGRALQFYHASRDDHREWAAICHQWKRAGYDPRRSVRAEFRGLTRHGQLVQSFPDKKMIRCSILDLNAQNLPRFAEAIRRCGADFYHGYPSALYLVAKLVNSGLPFPQPKALLLASEQVYPWQLSELQRAFPGAKILSHYGCSERVVLAAWCERQQSYHVLPQYSVVEVDDATGEIIGTNLCNTVNPFIRYRITDAVTRVSHAPCASCGRPYTPLLELSGRSEDFLYSPEKGWIPPAIVTYPLKSLQAVREIQFVQREKASLQVRYSLLGEDGPALGRDLADIEAGLRHLLGAGMALEFVRVDGFDRGPTGKFKWIVSELDGL